ncbi:MAG: tRNA-dihydrouridine synthase [Gammaproteobacteria bacterium]|nr:tRNA-dihydrouridine synthase [Gammaproteobacteria bacterium]MDP2139999.1 tRNA-dihydrouridine synthase [Gammaproteobacteria bacterium]MDP2347819.1 tRNA-dihydrouridine synthase [Gammaproteobacteria bacterium]
MRIVLAPMEGLADVHLRRLITAQGGFDWTVSEFVRVVDRLYPDKVLYGMCPELKNGGRTDSGTPMRVQLLGSDTEAMAANAVRAVELGSYGIDINFGCPSRTVNRRHGGAIMLCAPDSVYRVVSAVRAALPANVVVSAKMRLGFDDTLLMLENAAAIEAAGATELTVHARTRRQGYAPPAHWHELARIREHIRIPLIANGDICSVEDYHRCVAAAGTVDVMLGRGAVRMPSLARQIRDNCALESPWASIEPLLGDFWRQIGPGLPPRDRIGRIRQWVNYLRQRHPEAEVLWQIIRQEADIQRLDAVF